METVGPGQRRGTGLRPLGIVVPVLVAGCLPLAASALDEYELKARLALVVRSYVNWPQGAAKPLKGRILGIVGRSPFGRAFETLQGGGGAAAEVVYFPRFTAAEAARCDVLFICASEERDLERILSVCRGRPIFTLGDSPGFARRGVMLNLLLSGDRVRLEVNLRAARDAGLTISSAFLSLPGDRVRVVDSP